MFLGLVVVGLGALTPPAVAQSEADPAEASPGQVDEVRLITSKSEVRRAVVGLLATAVILTVLTGFYWYKTGQQARLRLHMAKANGAGSRRTALPSNRRERPPPAPRRPPEAVARTGATEDIPWWEREDY